MTHSNIHQDIAHVQTALDDLDFKDQSTLENAPKDLQTLLNRVMDEYQIKLTSEQHHLKDVLKEVKVELEIEASYQSQSNYRP